MQSKKKLKITQMQSLIRRTEQEILHGGCRLYQAQRNLAG